VRRLFIGLAVLWAGVVVLGAVAVFGYVYHRYNTGAGIVAELDRIADTGRVGPNWASYDLICFGEQGYFESGFRRAAKQRGHDIDRALADPAAQPACGLRDSCCPIWSDNDIIGTVGFVKGSDIACVRTNGFRYQVSPQLCFKPHELKVTRAISPPGYDPVENRPWPLKAGEEYYKIGY
jgi:hypothetical protein